MSTWSVLAQAIALAVALPCAILAIECLAACLPPRRRAVSPGPRPRVVVLVPAHDEELYLPDALRSILPELSAADRLLVVAHNCSDRTAQVARAAGAEVLEVRDSGSGGKPDALRAGLVHLDRDPPEIVVIVDADCCVAPGAIPALAAAARSHGGPVQGDYRFAPRGEGSVGSVSSLALLVKNVVRPTGLARLGLPCLLNGAGSAYPFEQLRSAPHGQGSIAEDYQLSIDLALRGHPTRFVPEARVESALPVWRGAALRQRRRWEHGHLALVFHTAPGLVLRGVLCRRLSLIALGLDLLVPPLAFLALAWGVSALAALGDLALTGQGTSAWIALLAGTFLVVGILAGTARIAGLRTAVAALVCAPRYVLWKLPLYLGFFRRRETRWRKTERT